jgi:hypothetical protein
MAAPSTQYQHSRATFSIRISRVLIYVCSFPSFPLLTAFIPYA